MTGEMGWIKPNGDAGDGSSYPLHAQVARRLRSRLRPFDTYIGPYIAHKRGHIFISSDDGIIGQVCLWPDGQAPAYRDPIVAEFFPLDDVESAIEAAREVCKVARSKK